MLKVPVQLIIALAIAALAALLYACGTLMGTLDIEYTLLIVEVVIPACVIAAAFLIPRDEEEPEEKNNCHMLVVGFNGLIIGGYSILFVTSLLLGGFSWDWSLIHNIFLIPFLLLLPSTFCLIRSRRRGRLLAILGGTTGLGCLLLLSIVLFFFKMTSLNQPAPIILPK